MTITLTDIERQIVEGAIQEINAFGWCKGTYFTEDGRMCGSAALSRSATNLNLARTNDRATAGKNIRAKFQELHGMNVPLFNDEMCTKQSDITDALAALLED